MGCDVDKDVSLREAVGTFHGAGACEALAAEAVERFGRQALEWHACAVGPERVPPRVLVSEGELGGLEGLGRAGEARVRQAGGKDAFILDAGFPGDRG